MATNKSALAAYDVRVAVINTLLAIEQGKSLTTLLDPLLNSLKGEDKAFAHALLLTTLRHWYATARLLDSLADNPIDEVAVRVTIQVGITQLLYLHVADHAAIHETVEAVKKIDLARASGLINAILRKVAKNPNKFRKKCDKNHSLPNWLAQQLKTDWREQYNELTHGLRQAAPMFLRVNALATTANQYLETLSDEDIEADSMALNFAFALTDAPTIKAPNIKASTAFGLKAIRLSNSVSVKSLPNFATGMVSVQDVHAQLAAPIIHAAVSQMGQQSSLLPRKLRLLDACAAPGGKLAHWLELIETPNNIGGLNTKTSVVEKAPGNQALNDYSGSQKFHVKQNADKDNHIPEVSIIAIDNEANRITRIFENLERLQLPRTMSKRALDLEVVCADATVWQYEAAKDESDTSNNTRFDAILLDAPCTATGVIRRHPDISLLRTEEDVEQTVALQAQILDNLWEQLNQGGYLLYVTCSILKAENIDQMQAFISRHSDAVHVPFADDQCNWGIQQEIGRQCLPVYQHEHDLGGDGFYFALLKKAV
ncbi:MAG: transcription antitermination factor NusB [Psychrobacter sp.]|nr:transcription antitermination factor NusB [Psychrobacter sp.]